MSEMRKGKTLQVTGWRVVWRLPGENVDRKSRIYHVESAALEYAALVERQAGVKPAVQPISKWLS